MPWHAKLQLHYTHDGHTTGAHDRHEGPLRVLQRLYPEGPAICHHVLVHPPGGIVGGDVLALEARLESRCHALITTPGATRFYRSAGDTSTQSVQATLAEGARLEWLPMETIAYSACLAHNQLRFEPGAGRRDDRLGPAGAGPARGRPGLRARALRAAAGAAGRLAGTRLHRRGRYAAAGFTAGLGRPARAGDDVVCRRFAPAAGTARRPAGRRTRARWRSTSSCRPMPAPPRRTSAWWCCACWPIVSSRRCSCSRSVWAAWRGAAWDLAATPPRLWRT